MMIWQTDEACVEAREKALDAGRGGPLSYMQEAALDAYARAVAVAVLKSLPCDWVQDDGDHNCVVSEGAPLCSRCKMLAELGGADD